MSRSRFGFTLGMALTCAGWAHGQNVPASPSLEARVGKTITVAEAQRPVERGTVLQAWRLPDGSSAMMVRALDSGETMTIIESATPSSTSMPYVVFRWGKSGVPPKGCPMPPRDASNSMDGIMVVGGQMQTVETATPPARVEHASPPIATSATRIWSATTPPAMPSAPAAASHGHVAGMPMSMPAASSQVTHVAQGPVTTIPAKPVGEKIVAMPRVKGEVATVRPSAVVPASAGMPTAATKTASTITPPPAMPSATKVIPTQAQLESKPIMRTSAASGQRVIEMASLPDCNGAVGRIITVTEKNCPTQRCVVLRAYHGADGRPTMEVQSLDTNETMTLVEAGHGKVGGLFSRWRGGHGDGVAMTAPAVVEPPAQAPMPKPAPAPQLMPAPKPANTTPPPAVGAAHVEPAPRTVVQKDVVMMPSPAEQLPVPVPLVPLATAQPRPNVEPPQPPINAFNTMKSVAMDEVNRTPVVMKPSGEGTATAAAKSAPANVEVPVEAPAGAVMASGWTRAPIVPVTQTSVMANMNEREAQTMQNVTYWLGVLQSAGAPSQREQAAMQLKNVDPQMMPYVVETLATVAKTDSAALVRAAAIATLGHVKATSTAAISAIEAGTRDKDPRVRDEAQQALATMGVQPGKSDVRQAGHQRMR